MDWQGISLFFFWKDCYNPVKERLSRITLALLLTEGRFSRVKASQRLGLFLHDHLTRELAKEVVYTAVLMPLEALPKAGDLSVDDTVVAKPHANDIEGLEYTYSSSDNKVLLTGVRKLGPVECRDFPSKLNTGESRSEEDSFYRGADR